MAVEITTLPSGLTIVTDAMAHLETAALGVWVGAGGRHETAREHGISHMLEHMAFKGTERRSARAIVEDIESVGGDLNAATSAETTAYFARVLKADVPLALDVLSDILAHPAFDAEELAREKHVIIQEIGAALDMPDDVVFEHLAELAYPDHAIGRSLLGTPQTVHSFSREDLRAYLAHHYQAPRMVVAAAGAVDHKAVVEEAAQRFASFNGEKASAQSRPAFVGGTKISKRKTEQGHLALALSGLPQTDPSIYSLQAFASIVGGGMSSRLFQEVREKRGLCYSIYSFHVGYSDTGYFGLYSGADAADAPELMQVVIDELHQAAHQVSEAEVARVKAQMKAGLLMALESCSARAEQMARHIFAHGRVLTTAELIARIDAVTPQSVSAAGQALLQRGRPAFSALGTGKGLDQAAKVVADMKHYAA